MQSSPKINKQRFFTQISAWQDAGGYWQGKFSVTEENGGVLTGLCASKCDCFKNAVEDALKQVEIIIKNCGNVSLFNYWLRQYSDN